MAIYGDLEESLLQEFNSSTKHSIEDIALDEEEKNKIIFNISGSSKARIPDLRVDYSDFSNHIFFASAYSSVNYSLTRILEYPVDGELQEIDEWKNINSGYENWFYDQFPKDHGHIFLQSGSSTRMSVGVRDFENKVNFKTGSFTLEAVVNPWSDMVADDLYPIITIASQSTDFVSLRFEREANEKYLELSFGVLGSPLFSISASYDSFVSSSHHVAAVCNRSEALLYIDGVSVASASVGDAGAATGSLDFGAKNIDIGQSYFVDSDEHNYYSGTIDEVRIWSSARPSALIKRNFNRTIYANKSGSLRAYYKFNEPWLTSSNRIMDYSGNSLEASFSGTYSASTNYISGNMGSLLRDPGDIILDFKNDRVDSFVIEQRDSGSLYDKDNSNYIFELIPSFLIDESNSEDQMKFFLLIARHWDRLTLYIKHLSSIYNSTVATHEDTPSDYLNHVARHYGLDIGGVYESSDPLQYFYGENVLATGSLDSSLRDVRDQIKRNIVNNLIHLYKTKSTKEALSAALRTLGLDDEIISVNQYSNFSGGLETTYEAKTVERRTLRFDGSEDQYITLHTSSYSNIENRTYQFRFNLISGSYTGSSAPITSSLFRIEEAVSGSNIMEAEIWRENISSSLGRIALYHSTSTDSPVTSSLFSAYDDRWINLSLYRQVPGASNLFGFNVVGLDRDEISFHFSGSGTTVGSYNPAPAADIETRIGTIAGKNLFSNYQELRVWSKILDNSSVLEKHTKDFESLVLEDFFEEIGNGTLLSHLRLDDNTGSADTSEIHDYLDSKSGSNYTGFSSSAAYNFPGSFIRKMQPSYGYDLNIDNDKIRIKDSDSFSPSDITEDIQMVSLDFSPISSLNKEIIKWFGDIEQFSNIIGHPYLKYRDEVTELNAYRNKFFSERLGKNGIDFDAYLKIIKWFDSNFSYFLRQLIPLDLVASLSNFVIEPHIFEYNKVKSIFPYVDERSSRILEGTVSVMEPITASNSTLISVADPGRWGAFASASALVTSDVKIDYVASNADAVSINHKNLIYRKVLRSFLSGGAGTGLQSQYGNGYHTVQISCSNYERDVLNVNTKFHISGAHHGTPGGDSIASAYLSSAVAPHGGYTGSFNSIQDARWQWYEVEDSRHDGQSPAVDEIGPRYDTGLGYGGAAGQLWAISKKSIVGETFMFSVSGATRAPQIGKNTTWSRATPVEWITTIESKESGRKSVILWPEADSYGGVDVYNAIGVETTGSFLSDQTPAAAFGPIIEIGDFTNLAINLVGSTSEVYSKLLIFIFKFQFFDDNTGETGFESILSSSTTPAGGIKTERKEHSYEFQVTEFVNDTEARAETFLLSFERELPKAKKMRIHITVITNGIGQGSSDNAVFTILTKGVLSKGAASKDLALFRDI